MDTTLVKFAKEVRQECWKIMGSCLAAGADQAGFTASQLAERCATIIREIEMGAEQANVQTLDLAALTALPHGTTPEPADIWEE